MRSLVALAACVAATLSVAQSSAEERDADVERRLVHVQNVLERDEGPAKTWLTAWLIAYSGLVVSQGAIALFAEDPGLRVDAAVGGAKSALGLGALVFRPFRPGHAASDLAKLPGRTPKERRAKLREAERLLRESAEDEELGTGAAARIAASVVNLAGTYYLWLEHERFGSGWLALASGMAVTELQIRTHPTHALEESMSGGRTTAARLASFGGFVGPSIVVSGSF